MRKLLPIIELVIIASLVLLGWQIFSSPSSLLLLVGGVLVYLLVNHRKRRGKLHNNFLQFVGLVLILLALTTQQAFWLVLFLLLLLVVFFLPKGLGQQGHFFWRRKKYKAPQVSPQSEVNRDIKIKRNPWLGDQNIGSEVYQWDDINLKELGGDTIIDLGNTLLPVERENIVILQKGFGKTRILVPFGTGVYLEHSTFLGSLKFSGQEQELKNQSMTMKSPDYLHRERRIRIVSSCLLGNLEVVYV